MVTARAVTNEVGVVRSLKDAGIGLDYGNDHAGVTRNWSVPRQVALGDILDSDTWSLLACYALRQRPSLPLHTKCTLRTTTNMQMIYRLEVLGKSYTLTGHYVDHSDVTLPEDQ